MAKDEACYQTEKKTGEPRRSGLIQINSGIFIDTDILGNTEGKRYDYFA